MLFNISLISCVWHFISKNTVRITNIYLLVKYLILMYSTSEFQLLWHCKCYVAVLIKAVLMHFIRQFMCMQQRTRKNRYFVWQIHLQVHSWKSFMDDIYRHNHFSQNIIPFIEKHAVTELQSRDSHLHVFRCYSNTALLLPCLHNFNMHHLKNRQSLS